MITVRMRDADGVEVGHWELAEAKILKWLQSDRVPKIQNEGDAVGLLRNHLHHQFVNLGEERFS